MYIRQIQLDAVKKNINKNKVLVVYGPRRCGKTTLLKKFLETYAGRYRFVSGDDIFVKEELGSQSIEKLKGFAGDSGLLIIDEAQRIPSIGLNLKLIIDHIEGVDIIATGSSSFDLAQSVGEPLTGRKITLKLFPLAQMEIMRDENPAEVKANLEHRLIYGSYPEVVTSADNETRAKYLRELVNSYLLKDILELDGVRHSDRIVKLLQLLAFQMGQEVSFVELGKGIGMSRNTIERYVDLLEKSFVIFRLGGFSRNLRKEVSKNCRCFFHDVGIRNALINNFNPLSIRNDVGMLWENYVIAERIKKQEYTGILSNNYFWRTYDRKEIDFVEERGGKLYGYEIKWKDSHQRPPKEWHETYPGSSYECISTENYLKFIA